MPELPDVEGFKRVLARNGLRKRIAQVTVNDARILGKLSARTFASRLQGASLVEVRRHGKHLMAELDRGSWLTLHFGMAGALQFGDKSRSEPPFSRVRLDFACDGSLAHINKRMIGCVGLVEDAADFVAAETLGPDALDRRFTFDVFKTAVVGLKRDVKSVLMDQQILAGIGNIYSDEILFQARISPTARIDKLAPSELRRLFAQMRKVLKTAVSRGAGSEQSVEHMPKGSLLLQRKKGGRCPRCLSPPKLLRIGGRTAYCCAKCQGRSRSSTGGFTHANPMAPMNDGGETKPTRIFVGLKISSDTADQLGALVAELKETRARLIAAADVHLTLVPPWQEVSIDQAVARLRLVAGMFRPFPLQLQHLGYGPQPRRPSLLWVDCAITDELTALRDALTQAFPQGDSRPFRPHVTLARIRVGECNFARRHPIDKDLNLIQPVRTVELFQSPPPGTTGYQILASVELGGPRCAAAATTPGGSVTAG